MKSRQIQLDPGRARQIQLDPGRARQIQLEPGRARQIQSDSFIARPGVYILPNKGHNGWKKNQGF